jgi:hypothetical protein
MNLEEWLAGAEKDAVIIPGSAIDAETIRIGSRPFVAASTDSSAIEAASYVPNGLGPAWFPKWLTRGLTQLGRMFFDEANWGHHDHGYARGYPARAECDRLFLMAMLRDASLQPSVLRAWGCGKAAWFLWGCVRAFGWASYVTNEKTFKPEGEP